MDRELSTDVIRKRRIRRWIKISAAVTLLVVSLYGLRAIIRPSISRGDIRTAIAELGSIEATVTASGTVVPGFEQVITSPISSRVDSVLFASGDRVSEGESVLRLDMESIRIQHDKLEDELKLKKNKKDQLRLTIRRDQDEMQAECDIKTLQVKFLKGQLDREEQLFKIGASNKTLIDQARLSLKIAERELELLANKIRNQEERLEADLRGLDLEIRIGEKNIAEIRRRMELAEARSDRDGIVTWVDDDIGSTVNAGDVVARVADLGSYKIEARISDIHADKLREGVPVKVRIDESEFTGEISKVQPEVNKGIMTFLVELSDPTNEKLRPNLRADVFVITSYKDNVIRVRKGPFYVGLVDQPVYIIMGDQAVRKYVSIGESNYDYTEIIGDIEPGDEVIISDMSDYSHMERINLDEE